MTHAKEMLRKLIEKVGGRGGIELSKDRSIPTDGQWVAIGLMAVADSLSDVSASIDNRASNTDSTTTAIALGDGLGDVARALTGIAASLPDR